MSLRRSCIEACRPADMNEVALLYEQVARSGGSAPSPQLAEMFRRIFFAPANFDPELPSLVYRDGSGAICGFLGVYPRRMFWNDRPIRMACSGHLVTKTDARARLAGVALMQRFLGGPQDLSITDGATRDAARIWQRLGGIADERHCLRWTIVLRPVQFLAEVAISKGIPRVFCSAASPVTWPVDRVLHRRLKPVRDHELSPLSVEAICEHYPRLAASRCLRMDYDPALVNWLLDELPRAKARGPLVAQRVATAKGTLGWYIYYLTAPKIAEVVQIVAADGAAHDVTECLIADAQRRGAVAIQGRLESGLAEALSDNRAFFQRREPLALIHSHNRDIVNSIRSGDALLTRADGEWWASFHLERFA